MKIRFCGAAKIVTGSCYWIKTGDTQILVDCGMFQGTKDITRLNYETFKFEPRRIDYVFLTHAHIDHSGLIPKLKKEGFKGKIFTTSATIDLCRIMLEDSAHLQVQETEHENQRRAKKGLSPREPLYQDIDVKQVMPLFEEVKYDEKVDVKDNISVCYRDAGHIIGSAIIELYIKEKGKQTKFVFSGDLGQWNVPIIKNPTLIQDADYVFIESTYGNRLHEDVTKRDDILLKVIKDTYKKTGQLLIPSFAIERTQEILYALNKIIKSQKFPDQKIFLNSPLAIKATEVFKRHSDLFDKEALTRYKDPFSFKNLVYTPTTQESIKLNDYKKPCIIIAGSGMCTGGRIRYHLKLGLPEKKNTVLFVGYQAEGTLGRFILEGAKKVKMMGKEITVKADIQKINSFSAHADYKELIKWAKGFKKKPKKIFVVHGEEHASESLKQKLEPLGFRCHVPIIGEEVKI